MENIKGTTSGSDKQNSGHLSFEEFVPSSAWTEELAAHYLLVDLPGFRREELKLQVEDRRHIVVSGERRMKDNKYMRFEQKFLLPENSDIGKITGKIDGEILYVSVPKKIIKEENKLPKFESHIIGEADHKPTDPTPRIDTKTEKEKTNIHNTDDKLGGQDEVFHDANGDGWMQKGELLVNAVIKSEYFENAVIKITKNKRIVITAVLAFSLGVFASQKLHSNGE